MDASGPAFPVRHKKISLDMRVTELILSSVVMMIIFLKEEGVSINPTFHVSVIFGKRDDPVLVACARQLIEHISNSGSSKLLVLSLGLKDHSVGTLKGVVSTVTENSLW